MTSVFISWQQFKTSLDKPLEKPLDKPAQKPSSKRQFVYSLLGVFFSLLINISLAQINPSPPSSPAPSPVNPTTSTLEDWLFSLTPGQTGYALTAGAGNQLERFAVEILGMQYDNAAFPLVLIRVSGKFIDGVGGVAAGMSGSPVYIPDPVTGQDRLLGAICCAFPNSDAGLGLVTPIEVMEQADPLTKNTAQLPSIPAELLAGWHAHHPQAAAVPIATPIMFAGLSEKARDLVMPLFANASTTPITTPLTLGTGVSMQTLGSLESADADFAAIPGMSISVQLVRGDITIAAVGTITDVQPHPSNPDLKLVYAFGHPLLEDGTVEFAFAPAHVAHIIPNDIVPFKLANNGRRILGTITQDRPYAISGVLNSVPRYLPISISLSKGLSLEETPIAIAPSTPIIKRIEVVEDEEYYPVLVAAATYEAFNNLLAESTGGTAELVWEISLATGEKVTIKNQIADDDDLAFATARLAGVPLYILASNMFAPADVARVNLDIRYTPTRYVADIVQVVLEQPSHSNSENIPSYRPKDTLIAHVRLQPYRKPAEVQTLVMPLPAEIFAQDFAQDWEKDTLQLIVRGGLEPATRANPRPNNRPSSENDEAEKPQFLEKILSFEELLGALQQDVQASELVVETIIDGEVTRLARLPLPYLVAGVETVRINVDLEQNTSEPDTLEPNTSTTNSTESSPEETP